MLYYHVTPTRRVGSICKHGLFARMYRQHPMLVAQPPEEFLRDHLRFYRNHRLCQPNRCSVVVFDIPPSERENYISDPRRYRMRLAKKGVHKYYRALRQPIPGRLVKGHAPLLGTRTIDLLEGRFPPCPKRPHTGRAYIREGRLLHVPRFAGWRE